jgi:hypothetical protein
MKVISKEAIALHSEARAEKTRLATAQEAPSESINRIDATLMTARYRTSALILPAFSAAS